MQLTKTLIASAVLACAGGSATAATPVGQIIILSSASAPKGNLKIALTNRCSGQLGEFASGNNVSTYVCAPAGSFANANAPTAAEYAAATPLNFTGTAFAEVRLNVTGGSFTAACLMAFGTTTWATGATACANVNAGGAADSYVEPSTGTLAPAPAGSVIGGGFMDVEPALFDATVTAGVVPGGTNVATPFAQVFGVAASAALWDALYADQKTVGILPASCPAVATSGLPSACWPVIGKPEMATILSGNQGSALYLGAPAPLTSNGVGFLMKDPANKTTFAGQTLEYARRVDTSGTQASAQNYFLGTRTGKTPITVVGCNASVAPITVDCLASTGDVRTRLQTAGYVLGVMSAENNQNQSWRWLRVAGVPVGEDAFPGAATNTNTNTAQNGLYDFWYTLRIQRPTAAPVTAFWSSVVTGLGAAPSTVGLFRPGIGFESTYTHSPNGSFSPVSQ